MFVGAGALTALGVLAAPQLVSAHIADVVKSCNRLEVSVVLFDDGVQTQVTIDGTTTVQNGNGHWVFAWSETEMHTYKVVVDAVKPQDDKSFTGEQAACIPPPDSTTTPATVPATTVAAPETASTQVVTPTIEASTPTTPASPQTTSAGTPITQNLATPTSRASGGGGASGSGGRSSGSGGGELPSTGPNDTAPFIEAGLVALAAGAALVYVARRGTRGGTPS
jgi:LPXTG-motif cell wall-anchored protein